jgi:Skp family chaperone for outer membrane proteins
MKKLFVFICILSLSSTFGQKTTKIGYIDMNYILEKLPEYAEAKNSLEQKAAKWTQDIEGKKQNVKTLKEKLDAEKVLLTKELVSDKEKEIKEAELELIDYQQKRFGPQGDLIIQKNAMVKPIQDQVFNIVQDIAKDRGYDFIFDRSSDATMLFTAERFDISDFVLKQIERAGKKVELTKKQKKDQDKADKREMDVKENPEILKKEQDKADKASATKEEREKKIQERKDAYEARKKEIEDKKQQQIKEREAAREKILADQKAKQEALKKKAEENKKKE